MADLEIGLRWWLRYVAVPIIAGGGVIAIVVGLIRGGSPQQQIPIQITVATPTTAPQPDRQSSATPPTGSNEITAPSARGAALVEHSQNEPSSTDREADQRAPSTAAVNVSNFDGDWESLKYRYGFDLRGGRGRATLTNSSYFSPGDTILRIERVTSNRFFGEQMYTNGSWVKVTGRLRSLDRLEMSGGGLIWVMQRR